MKKFITLVLALLCVLGLVGCKTDKQGSLDNDDVTGEFTFIVIEASESHLLVAEIGEDGKAIKSKQYSVPNVFHPNTEIVARDKVVIHHNGVILETFPMQFGHISSMEYYDHKTGLNVIVNID